MTQTGLAGLLLLLLLPSSSALGAGDGSDRVWEVNGIRLEAGQVERLADDVAERTVEAVQRNVAGIELEPAQLEQMRAIYREVSLDVYGRVVEVVEHGDGDDRAKEARVRALVLEGQERSHELLAAVLSPGQMELYSAWERSQVEAFKSRRWDRRRRRRR